MKVIIIFKLIIKEKTSVNNQIYVRKKVLLLPKIYLINDKVLN